MAKTTAIDPALLAALLAMAQQLGPVLLALLTAYLNRKAGGKAAAADDLGVSQEQAEAISNLIDAL